MDYLLGYPGQKFCVQFVMATSAMYLRAKGLIPQLISATASTDPYYASALIRPMRITARVLIVFSAIFYEDFSGISFERSHLYWFDHSWFFTITTW